MTSIQPEQAPAASASDPESATPEPNLPEEGEEPQNSLSLSLPPVELGEPQDIITPLAEDFFPARFVFGNMDIEIVGGANGTGSSALRLDLRDRNGRQVGNVLVSDFDSSTDVAFVLSTLVEIAPETDPASDGLIAPSRLEEFLNVCERQGGIVVSQLGRNPEQIALHYEQSSACLGPEHTPQAVKSCSVRCATGSHDRDEDAHVEGQFKWFDVKMPMPDSAAEKVLILERLRVLAPQALPDGGVSRDGSDPGYLVLDGRLFRPYEELARGKGSRKLLCVLAADRLITIHEDELAPVADLWSEVSNGKAIPLGPVAGFLEILRRGTLRNEEVISNLGRLIDYYWDELEEKNDLAPKQYEILTRRINQHLRYCARKFDGLLSGLAALDAFAESPEQRGMFNGTQLEEIRDSIARGKEILANLRQKTLETVQRAVDLVGAVEAHRGERHERSQKISGIAQLIMIPTLGAISVAALFPQENLDWFRPATIIAGVVLSAGAYLVARFNKWT